MMKNTYITATIIAAMAVALSSCTKQKLELTYTSQETKIDSYVESVMKSDSTVTVSHNKGAARLTLKAGEGEALQEGGTISFYYAGYVFQSMPSDLFATNNAEIAQSAGWNLDEEQLKIMTFNMSSDTMVKGLRNGLIGVRAGEECEIIFSGKYGFGKKTFGIIPANSALLYKIWVHSISNE